VESWISSLRDSPANRSATQVTNGEKTTPDTSGLTYSASPARSTRSTSSLRTSPGLSQPTLPMDGLPPLSSAKIWKNWASALRRVYSARRKSARRSAGSDGFSWPTTTATSGKAAMDWGIDIATAAQVGLTPDAGSPWRTPMGLARGKAGNNNPNWSPLHDQVRNWPTPTEDDMSNVSPEVNRQYSSLAKQAALWPTPGANDHKGSAAVGQRRGQLDEAAEQKWPTPTAAERGPGSIRSHPPETPTGPSTSKDTPTPRPRLNPVFAEILMGWPPGWTCVCAAVEHASSNAGTESSPPQQP